MTRKNFKRAITKVQGIIVVLIVIIAALGGYALYTTLYAPPTPSPTPKPTPTPTPTPTPVTPTPTPTPTPSPTPVVEKIKVGCVYPLTGPVALEAAHIRDALEWLATKVNLEGGIKSLGGAKLELIWADSQGKPEIAMAETERLITQEKVSVIMGGWWSSMTYAIQEVCARYKVPNLCFSSSSPKLLERGYEWYFMCQLHDDHYAKLEVEFLVDLLEKEGLSDKVKTAGILVDAGLFSQTARESWIKYIKQFTDWEIVVDITHPVGTLDLTTEVLKLKEADPDVIFLSQLTEDAITAAKAMREQDYYAPITMTMDAGWAMVDFLNIPECKETAQYFFSRFPVLPDQPNPRLKELYDEFTEKFGYWDLIIPYCHMGMTTLVAALEEAGSTDPTDIRDAFRRIKVSPEEMVMPYGIDFDEKTGYNKLASASIGQMIGEYYSTVWPWEYKATDPVVPDPRSRGL